EDACHRDGDPRDAMRVRPQVAQHAQAHKQHGDGDRQRDLMRVQVTVQVGEVWKLVNRSDVFGSDKAGAAPEVEWRDSVTLEEGNNASHEARDAARLGRRVRAELHQLVDELESGIEVSEN